MKFLVYIILFAAPIWFYLTYVSGTLDDLVNAMNKLQGVPAKAETKFNGFENFIKDIRSKLPSLPQAQDSTSTTDR